MRSFRSKNRVRNDRSLRVESLENRQLMAGDVAVALEGQWLTIHGDNLANQISIVQDARGNVTVAGQQGTLINGLPSVRFLTPALNAMEVRMEGGDDVLSLRGVRLANDLFVEMGAGNDRVTTAATLPLVVGANAAFELGDGNDTIQLSGSVVGEDLNVNGGIGQMTANLRQLSVGKALNLIGDDQADSIVLALSTITEAVSIETKGGNDVINLSDSSMGGLLVNTDLGDDRATLTRISVQEDLGLFTGDGNDTVTLTDVASSKSITVSTDNGSDRIVARRVSAATDAVFEGGAGVDYLTDLGITGGVKKDLKEFEFIR